MKATVRLTAALLLLAVFISAGCAPAAKTDGPVSTVEQEELNDQLETIEKTSS